MLYAKLLFPYVGFLSWETIDLEATREALTQLLEEANAKLTTSLADATAQIEQQRAHAEEIVQAIRTASAEAGVGVHHELFSQAATKHEKAAVWCLVSAVFLALATAAGAAALVLFWDVNGNISEASVLQLVVAKAVFLAIGFYATTAAVRMYRAQLHLAVVNRHRETSLQTFQAFVKATEDLDTKNKVLLEATHAIFGQVPTGMVESGDGSGVVEVLDGVAGPLVRRG